jgi:hypothetical protein
VYVLLLLTMKKEVRTVLLPMIRSTLRTPCASDAVVVGPLKRLDEIGFKEGFDLIKFLLVFRSKLFVCDQVPLRHPDDGS